MQDQRRQKAKVIFKKKAALLSALVFALALLYTLTLIFDLQAGSSGLSVRRGRSFAWLDQSMLDHADRIELYGPLGVTTLSRRNNVWVCPQGNVDYPVKQARVGDLLASLSRREAYSLRVASLEGRERLGVTAEAASRIRIRGGAGLPLLDLLVGYSDALGTEVYLRKADSSEVYSGEDHFTLYTDSRPGTWYDLRLFPSDSPRAIEAWMVQQVEILLPGNEDETNSGNEYFTISRKGGGWVNQSNQGLDIIRVETWLRSLIEAEGESFSMETPDVTEGMITIHLGDGTSRIIRTGPPDEGNRRIALVSGSTLAYVLNQWSVSRLFREHSYFQELTIQ